MEIEDDIRVSDAQKISSYSVGGKQRGQQQVVSPAGMSVIARRRQGRWGEEERAGRGEMVCAGGHPQAVI